MGIYIAKAAKCGLCNSHSVFIGMGLQFALRHLVRFSDPSCMGGTRKLVGVCFTYEHCDAMVHWDKDNVCSKAFVSHTYQLCRVVS